MINKLATSHTGQMPIRVLQHNLIYAFENMNPDFIELTRKVIAELNLDPGIEYGMNREPVKSPRVIFGKIFIDESFLSYVWCVSFSLTVLYQEVIVKKSKNDYFRNEVEISDTDLVKKAYKLWEYAILLLDRYVKWDINLPNPESYDEHYEQLIPKINGLYITAMKFVLAHEFSHIELKHNERLDNNLDQNEQSVIFEREADDRAIKLVLDGRNNENRVTVNMGILLGLCSLLFFNSITKGETYPDTDERIDAVIKVIHPKDSQDPMWGIATLAYRLWDRQYNKGLIWQERLESPMELYYSIKHQVENL